MLPSKEYNEFINLLQELNKQLIYSIELSQTAAKKMDQELKRLRDYIPYPYEK